MWNKGPWNPWREPEKSRAAAKPDKAHALGSDLGSKRQRRPSVRLQEIGDCTAAPSAKIQKKFRFLVSSRSSHSRETDVPTDVEVDDPLESIAADRFKTKRVLKSRPLVLVNSDSIHGHTFSDGGSDADCKTASPGTLTSLSIATPVEDLPHLTSQHVITKTNEPESIKVSSKKARNKNYKRGSIKVAASMQSLPSTDPSSIAFKEDPQGNYTDEDEDEWTLEGFKDCHLEASEDVNDVKDMDKFQVANQSKGGYSDILHASQEYQPNPIQEHSLLERIKEPEQVSEGCLIRPEQEHGSMNNDGALNPLVEKANRELSYGYKFNADNHSLAEECMTDKVSETNEDQRSLETMKDDMELQLSRQHCPFKNSLQAYDHKYDKDNQCLAEQSILLRSNKFVMGSKNQRSKEPIMDNTELHLSRHHSLLLNGVRGWLQNLGLGKYAHHFEAHEVDLEVLPVLTFDDLKEMGITAVGSRRKMYTAIQQLGKCL